MWKVLIGSIQLLPIDKAMNSPVGSNQECKSKMSNEFMCMHVPAYMYMYMHM